MPILVIGGSGRDVGKTALICALIRELSEFRWTAVKVSTHGHRSETIWEESEAGQGTDTARYLAAGASRALLVSAAGNAFPLGEVRAALASNANVIFESNRVIDHLQPDIAVAIVGRGNDIKPPFAALLRRSNVVLLPPDQDLFPTEMPDVPVFRVLDLGQIPPGMITWLRERLARLTGNR